MKKYKATELPPSLKSAIEKANYRFITAQYCWPIEMWLTMIEQEQLMNSEIRTELMAFMLSSGKNENG